MEIRNSAKEKTKNPILPIRQPTHLAGFYSRFDNEAHFNMLGTTANESISAFHQCMAVLHDKKALEKWLSGNNLKHFLTRIPATITAEKAF